MSGPSSFILKWLQETKPGGAVLDLACGKGRHTRAALKAGFRVTAVDIDTNGLEDIRHENLEIVTADLEGAPWPFAGQRFDAIIITNYLWRPLFSHIADAVAPGGLLLYETFAVGSEKYGRPSNPAFLLKMDELWDAFHETFEVLHFEHGYTETPEPAVKQSFAGRK